MNPVTAQSRLHYRDQAGLERVVALSEAAEIAFEDGQMVRSIRHYRGSRHTPGRYWSASNGDLVFYESYLESKWMMLLDFNPRVVRFASQPFQLFHHDVALVARHVPDLFVRYADHSAEVIDVKNPARIDDRNVLAQAERTAAACAEVGWGFRLVGEPERQRLVNVSWLAGFRRPLHAGSELIGQLLSLAAAPVAIGELLRFVTPAELARSVLFHLLWRGDLVCDMDEPLRESTLVRCAKGSEAS
jgi:hypothetical protein